MSGKGRQPLRTGGETCLPRVSTGASGYRIELGEPRHVDVNGDFAYVVVPATMTFDLRGNQVTQTGSVYTVALRKVGVDWRLTAWAWAKGA